MTEDAVKPMFKQTLSQIGVIHSCFKEKFGIPRQAGIASEARAVVELFAPYGCAEALQGLEGFSHLWLLYAFHQARRDRGDGPGAENWHATVRPPRLGGNRRIGVFASRAPFRPNGIGMSAVALEEVSCDGGKYCLHVRGADVLDGTPLLDIKPYVPYADAIAEAQGGFAHEQPAAELRVIFPPPLAAQIEQLQQQGYPGLRHLIEQILSQDPRPAYMAASEQAGAEKPAVAQSPRTFGLRLYDFDLQWQVTRQGAEVLALLPL
jgi:tRNA-Thr(GGU) m(6)t(6)A37 methyltransferase TsaA